MYTVEKTVKVLTLVPDDGFYLTNYPTASILDCQIVTQVFVREDLAGPWRQISEQEKTEIEELKIQAEEEQVEQTDEPINDELN